MRHANSLFSEILVLVRSDKNTKKNKLLWLVLFQQFKHFIAMEIGCWMLDAFSVFWWISFIENSSESYQDLFKLKSYRVHRGLLVYFNADQILFQFLLFPPLLIHGLKLSQMNLFANKKKSLCDNENPSCLFNVQLFCLTIQNEVHRINDCSWIINGNFWIKSWMCFIILHLEKAENMKVNCLKSLSVSLYLFHNALFTIFIVCALLHYCNKVFFSAIRIAGIWNERFSGRRFEILCVHFRASLTIWVVSVWERSVVWHSFFLFWEM